MGKKLTATVILKDKTTGKYWVNRRALDKPYEPGHLQSVIGKCDPGETPITTAIRETQEEAGISLTKKQLIPMGVHKGDQFDSHIYEAHGDWKPKDMEPHKVSENWKLMTEDEIRKDDKVSCVLKKHIG